MFRRFIVQIGITDDTGVLCFQSVAVEFGSFSQITQSLFTQKRHSQIVRFLEPFGKEPPLIGTKCRQSKTYPVKAVLDHTLHCVIKLSPVAHDHLIVDDLDVQPGSHFEAALRVETFSAAVFKKFIDNDTAGTGIELPEPVMGTDRHISFQERSCGQGKVADGHFTGDAANKFTVGFKFQSTFKDSGRSGTRNGSFDVEAAVFSGNSGRIRTLKQGVGVQSFHRRIVRIFHIDKFENINRKETFSIGGFFKFDFKTVVFFKGSKSHNHGIPGAFGSLETQN